jgi:hypothetical protein
LFFASWHGGAPGRARNKKYRDEIAIVVSHEVHRLIGGKGGKS